MDPLTDPIVRSEMNRAWLDSVADDPTSRHEEGGYIVVNADGKFAVERWPRGERSRLTPPLPDVNNCYNGNVVVAAFHTHPNPSPDEQGRLWEQGPSESDRRWHMRQRLRGFVIGRTYVYEIDATGRVVNLGKREEAL